MNCCSTRSAHKHSEIGRKSEIVHFGSIAAPTVNDQASSTIQFRSVCVNTFHCKKSVQSHQGTHTHTLTHRCGLVSRVKESRDRTILLLLYFIALKQSILCSGAVVIAHTVHCVHCCRADFMLTASVRSLKLQLGPNKVIDHMGTVCLMHLDSGLARMHALSTKTIV